MQEHDSRPAAHPREPDSVSIDFGDLGSEDPQRFLPSLSRASAASVPEIAQKLTH